MTQTNDQRHPQESRDRLILDAIKRDANLSDYNKVELARLLIRYQNFPGARSFQAELSALLTTYDLTPETLFAQTRAIHASGQIYRRTKGGEESQDWS
ncbi:DUF3288 family protein [Spirulina major CS-329]|uniref:DUF3288 family protein n=1 Tax=Spirulina TaxID=1154 RepID=UPI002330DC9E|nr:MULTISPECIES: DUF3288 family protein [Spirulina]MDB9495874.1 DUF3288 family protein [Spirulina subsalsa CS-330]MDB9504686.1 DUF3288 family protein [Spirulina major CS-329]